MSPIAILGSGFGLYGYLPALVAHCGQRVVLPERYRQRLEERSELAQYASHVEWATDEWSALRAASGAVLALCPAMQSHWLAVCLKQPRLERLFLEKPLATEPGSARRWHERLEQSGKVVRIAYLFRHLDWAAQLRNCIFSAAPRSVSIVWRFLAHHVRYQIDTWKRDHEQGGGAIRFYGIHVIALLAELGYSRVVESWTCEPVVGEISHWHAVFSGAAVPRCDVEVDSAAAESWFSISSDSAQGIAFHHGEADPFPAARAANAAGNADRRVDVLGRFCQAAWSDPRPMRAFYKRAIDLWEQVEFCNRPRRTLAAPTATCHD